MLVVPLLVGWLSTGANPNSFEVDFFKKAGFHLRSKKSKFLHILPCMLCSMSYSNNALTTLTSPALL